jgi:hypothetical protein
MVDEPGIAAPARVAHVAGHTQPCHVRPAVATHAHPAALGQTLAARGAAGCVKAPPGQVHGGVGVVGTYRVGARARPGRLHCHAVQCSASLG